MASYRRGMATEEKRASRGDSSSWILGMLVGLAIGVSLGVAMGNIAVGIASGVGIGIAFSLAFSQSKKSQGTQKHSDDDHRKAG
jgi:hypothetical protein